MLDQLGLPSNKTPQTSPGSMSWSLTSSATWMNGNFPPNHWKYFNQHMHRTNNNVEGWHSRMKKVITKPHSNIFAWIEYIQREEAVTKAKIKSFRLGATPRPQRRRMKEKRLQEVIICIIRVGWGSLALGYHCIPLVLFAVFVYLIFLLSHKMCYLSLVCQASWKCLVCKSSCIHVVLAIDLAIPHLRVTRIRNKRASL